MPKFKPILIILSLIIYGTLFAMVAIAQTTKFSLDDFKQYSLSSTPEISKEEILSILLNNPQILNIVLKDQIIEKSPFLKDLKIDFKTFKANETDSLLGFGIGYSYQKNLTMTKIAADITHQSGLSLALQSQGNIAFDKKTNPNDFLDADFSFHLYSSWGGVISGSPEIFDKLNKLDSVLVRITDGRQLRNSSQSRESARIIQDHLSSHYYLDFALSGGIESNQDFSRKQYVFGGRLGFDFKPWRSGYWNIFDWPFAAIRWFSGYDNELLPRGSSFPTVLLGIDQVSPKGDEFREVLGDSASFFRWRGEIAFRTSINSSSYFEANLRYYKELNASRAIKQADQDEHLYFVALISTGSGIFASYTTGKLPFDLQSQQVYSLGFKFNF